MTFSEASFHLGDGLVSMTTEYIEMADPVFGEKLFGD
jgi:hypothetical protein